MDTFLFAWRIPVFFKQVKKSPFALNTGGSNSVDIDNNVYYCYQRNNQLVVTSISTKGFELNISKHRVVVSKLRNLAFCFSKQKFDGLGTRVLPRNRYIQKINSKIMIRLFSKICFTPRRVLIGGLLAADALLPSPGNLLHFKKVST